jgi:hypothetical protein
MKTLKLILTTTLTTLLLIISNFTFGQVFTKEISKEYQVDKTKYFQVSNQFGEIHIENWEQDKLSIVVTLSIDAKNQEKADEFFEKIEIKFDEKDTLISALTELKSSISDKDFSIDYKIFMPSYLRLDLTNSYGDVYIQELTGKSLITVKYGTLKAEKLIFGDTKPRSVIVLAYSEATIDECDWLKLMLSFSDIQIEKSQALIIKSKYSDIKIVDANSIVTESKYDNPFEIETVENFVCTGEYSDYNIGKITNQMNVDLKYSELNVEEVAKDFISLDVILKYGNADITINNGASYTLQADSEFGNIDVENNQNLSTTSDKTENKVEGVVGTNKNTESKVVISAKYANVDLK